MTTLTSEPALDVSYAAPEGAICADCGCTCQGETVVLYAERGPMGGWIRTFHHLTNEDCARARERSAAYWSKRNEA